MYYLKYINFLVILIGITFYSFFLVVDYKDKLFDTRSEEKNLWTAIFFVFLITTLYLIRYKYIE